MGEVERLESEDPRTFEELAARKRWTYVAKDPVKGMKDINHYKRDSLSLVQHLPAK